MYNYKTNCRLSDHNQSFIDNFVQPVQYFLDDSFFWDLSPGLRKKTDVFVQKNEAILIDEFLQLGQSQQVQFYKIERTREQNLIEDTDLQIVSVYIRLDSNFDSYSRRVYSFGDLLGQTGGMYSAVVFLGAVFVGIFSERLFVSSILRKIYQIDQSRDNEIRKEIIEKKTLGSKNKVNAELENGK